MLNLSDGSDQRLINADSVETLEALSYAIVDDAIFETFHQENGLFHFDGNHSGRAIYLETLLANCGNAMRNVVRHGDAENLTALVTTMRAEYGIQTLDPSIPGTSSEPQAPIPGKIWSADQLVLSPTADSQ